MKAKLKPLKGKYYGSEIEIILDDNVTAEIRVWIHDSSFTPSKRELEAGQYKSIQEAKENDLTCDSHFESDVCLEICEKIVRAINN